MEASSFGYRDIVELLLEHGADPSKTNAFGNTALMAAQDSEIANLIRAHAKG